ncbi:MAG: hypothetical protein ABUT20_07795, partial [Bacteroidota bacterium]
MKHIIIPVLTAIIISSCNHQEKAIVDPVYVDSLLNNHTISESAKTNKGDLAFWEQRMDSIPDNYVNGPKYAAALSLRFRLIGNIRDLLKADSLMQQSNIAYQGKEDGILFTLANFATQQHHFKMAEEYAEKAAKAGDNKYGAKMAMFDAAFELGQYDIAGNIIRTLKPNDTYPYYFRRSKFEHFNGSLDSSIAYMLKAVEKSEGNRVMQQAAISNAADLCIHKGDLTESYKLFKESIAIDAADFHSIMGIGWIALVHDKNDSLATKIFEFAHNHLSSPDPLLKLMQVAELKGDSINQKEWAEEFAAQATQPVYGIMYNKYLIELYTGILNNPQKAVELSLKETENRITPQTYAWYAWSLALNNEKEKAYSIYNQYISGRPLEGLELYYMGKLMLSLNKGYNAQEFFKAAHKNRYDLSPA